MGVKDGGNSHNIYIRNQFTPHLGLDRLCDIYGSGHVFDHLFGAYNGPNMLLPT